MDVERKAPVVAQRRLLIAIVATALAGLVAVSALSRGHALEVSVPFGVLGSLVVFGLAVAGKRLFWAIAFVLGVFGAALCGVWALTASSPDRAIGATAAAVWGVIALALWGLRPETRDRDR